MSWSAGDFASAVDKSWKFGDNCGMETCQGCATRMTRERLRFHVCETKLEHERRLAALDLEIRSRWGRREQLTLL